MEEKLARCAWEVKEMPFKREHQESSDHLQEDWQSVITSPSMCY